MHLVRRSNERIYKACTKMLVGCTFQVEKFRSDGTITYQGPIFHNVILDVGLDLLATKDYGLTYGNACAYMNVGTNNTTPATSQSGLISYLASTNTIYALNHGYSTTSPVHKWREEVFEFAIGSCTGNLTELGLSVDPNSEYFNRQLFRDSGGTPVTIVVASDEGLRITARLYLYSDLEPGGSSLGSFLLNGTDTIDYTKELTTDTSWLAAYDSGINAYGMRLTSFKTGVSDYFGVSTSAVTFDTGWRADSIVRQPYTAGDNYLDFECVWSPGTAIGDIASIVMQFPANAADQYSEYPFNAFRLSPVITLTDTDEFTLMLRRAWGRYVP